MVVTVSGTVTAVSELQLLNALSEITLSPEPIFNSFALSLFENAYFPILVTESGILISATLLHSEKA